MARVLIVEDELNLLNSLAFILEHEGWTVDRCRTGEEALALVEAHRPDLVLLDLSLPGMDGFEVAGRLAAARTAGLRIIVVTASDVEDDIVRALGTCADDYVVKPVRPRVLLARIDAVMRRSSGTASAGGTSASGGIAIDPISREARLDGAPLGLTRSEFDLLSLLVRNPDRVFTRAEIIAAVHGDGCVVTARCVDFQVHGLRRKLGAHGARLSTVRGVGFKLCDRTPPAVDR